MKHPFRWLGLIVFPLCFVAAGCGADRGGTLTFQSLDRNKSYEHQFPRAFCTLSDGGEYQAVLVSESSVTSGSGPRIADSTDRPIVPLSSAPMRQIVYIRVLWRPLRGVRPDSPTATNAAIDW